jgi:DNA-binding MarR family transcriptional regulator
MASKPASILDSDRSIAEPGPDQPTDPGRLPDLIGFNLRICYGIAAQIFARAFEPLDLAPIQFAALEFVANTPDRAQTEIAEQIGTAPSVLVGSLEKLERRGLITRGRDAADRRRFVVRATEEGEALLAEAHGRIEEVEDELTSGLDRAERATLLGLLRRVAGRA